MCLSSKFTQFIIVSINNNWISILTLFSLIVCNSLQSLAFPEESHEKCVPKSEASDIYLSCGTNERIAIYEAFFTTSARHRCSQSYTVITESTTQISEEEDNNNKYAFPRLPSACTDDIRLSLNRRCSSAPNCSFNFIKHHNHGCIGEDGSVIIRYTCISENKFHPFCNLNLSDSYGYVSTPGYPRFYPPYESCVWNIKGSEGQVIQIDILDVAIKEPDSKYLQSVINRKKVHYQCTDSLTLRESKSQTLTLCGEVKSNLLQYRTKSNGLTIEFTAFEFSPTRGILFRYSLQNCPTLPAPKNGHLIMRNGSFAYYSCCMDYVFEDTKQTDKVLYCQYGNHWNSSLSKCVQGKELSMSSSLILSNESNVLFSRSDKESDSDGSYISDIMIPIVLMIALLVGNAVIVWVLFRLKRRQKRDDKTIEATVPLNSGSCPQTNV